MNAKQKSTRKVSPRKKREIETRNKIERKAALTTGIFFIGLFVLFLIVGMRTPLPLPEEKGIDVVLGEHNVGMNKNFEKIEETSEKEGEKEQEQVKDTDQAEENKTAKEKTPSSAEAKDQTSQTQDKEPAPSMSKSKEAVEKEKVNKDKEKVEEEEAKEPEDETTEKQEREPDPKNMFTPSENSKGDKNKKGNQGEKSGSKDTKSFEDEGDTEKDADGISFSLEGRKITQYPEVEDKSQKYGKIVVEITVDKNGEVVKAEAGKRGTTITDLELQNLAEKAALDTKFTKDEQAPGQQVGTMTFNFQLR